MNDHLRKAFEQVTTGNVKVAVAHGNETRAIVRKLEKKIDHLEKINVKQEETNQRLQGLLTTLQAKVYSGGT